MDAARVATDYAERVAAGKVLACRLTRLACERHLRDLAEGPARGLRFNPAAAQHVIDFIHRNCRHVKGRWAGQLLELAPWQVFGVASLYGWQRDNGTRRFRRSYEEVARKNGKSIRKAAEGLYALAADLEQGAEVYSFATTWNQAAILFNVAKRMVAMEPNLQAKIESYSRRLDLKENGSTMAALHAKSRTQDGLSVSFAIADEFHAHPDRSMWDIISSATSAREQPLVQAITTAGVNLAGPCYELRDYATKVLEGTLQDDEFFAVIYTLDALDDWQNPDVWSKANPNLAVPGFLDDLQGKLAEACVSPAAAATFKTKHQNLWLNSSAAYFDAAQWRACGDTALRAEDFQGCRCWIAIDLAQVIDANAVVLLFERDGHFYCFPRFYLPQAVVDQNRTGSHAHWERWAKRGHVRLTAGDVIDMDVIEGDIRQLWQQFGPVEIPFDPYQSTQMVTHLLEAGAPMVQFALNAKTMTPPMRELARLVAPSVRRIHHDANPVMEWMMGNVVAKVDAKDNLYPRKEFPQNKIDGPVALMIAMARAMAPNAQLGLPSDPDLLFPMV